MVKIFQDMRGALAQMPGTFRAALGLAAGFMVFVAWDQSHWWRAKEDYSFGWLVPLFVVFVVYDRWVKIEAALAACAVEGSPRARGWRAWVLGAGMGTFGFWRRAKSWRKRCASWRSCNGGWRQAAQFP